MTGLEHRKVKVGVVGCGVVATAYYLPYLMTHAALVAVCDLNERRTAACARLFGAREQYQEYDAMIAQADIEAVFVLSGPGTHARFAVRAIEAGKHVLLQKPMATTMPEVQAIVAAVHRARTKVLIEPSAKSPLEPGYAELRALIMQGAIGTPYAFFSLPPLPDRDHPSLGGNPYGTDAFYSRDSGGILFDYPYAPSEVVSLLGPCKSVMGTAAIAVPERFVVPESDYDAFLEAVTQPQEANYWDVVGRTPRTQPVRMEAADTVYSLYEMSAGATGVVWAGRAFHPLPPGMRLGA